MHVVDNVTLLLAGTKNGTLLRLHVRKSQSNKLEAVLLDQEDVDTSSRPLISLTLSHDGMYVYIVANKTDDSAVYRRPVISCSQHTSCQSCLNVSAQADIQHPLCGWCATTSTCTRQTQCTSAIWERTSSQCPSVVSLTPSQAPAQVATNVVLKAKGMVPSVLNYECGFDFDGIRRRTPANRLDSDETIDFSCNSPVVRSLNRQLYVDSEVSIFATRSNAPLVKSGHLKMTVYDCEVNSNCSACQSSRFTCGWCNYDNQCTHHRPLCRHNNGSSDWTASASIQCPAATLQLSHPFLPTGVSKTYTFTITNAVLARVGGTISYACRFTSGPNTDNVPASLSSSRNSVSCSANALPSKFGGSTGKQSGKLALLFNNSTLVARPVTYFTCLTLGHSCQACVNFSECFFCPGQSKCVPWAMANSCKLTRIKSSIGCQQTSTKRPGEEETETKQPLVTQVTNFTCQILGDNCNTCVNITRCFYCSGQSRCLADTDTCTSTKVKAKTDCHGRTKSSGVFVVANVFLLCACFLLTLV